MKKLTSDIALSLLLKDVIKNKKDLENTNNRWIKHCIYVAIASGRIAKKLNLDEDYAIALGYIHDIGRKVSHANHPIAGYEYMVENGFPNEARICITHSFINNNINYTAGGIPTGRYNGRERYDIINDYLKNTSVNIYDNIVQMCDLFCLETGFTTIEKRMLDITKRKGVYNNSMEHLTMAMELKRLLEEKMGCSLYTLFPEISSDVITNVDSDHKDLVALINDGNNEHKLIMHY